MTDKEKAETARQFLCSMMVDAIINGALLALAASEDVGIEAAKLRLNTWLQAEQNRAAFLGLVASMAANAQRPSPEGKPQVVP